MLKTLQTIALQKNQLINPITIIKIFESEILSPICS